jgi:hypothetical protein
MWRERLARFVPLRHARAPADDASTTGSPGNGAGPSDAARRTLLTRGLSVVAGAVSVGAAGALLQSGSRQTADRMPVAATAHSPLTPVPMPDVRPTELALFIRNVRASSPGQAPGQLPGAGTPAAPHGRLVDANGTDLGVFSGGLLAGSAGQIAFQRFVFSNGTLIGMGSGSLAGEEYAVVGGTGVYAGVVGTYQTQLHLGTNGKDAEFTFNISGVR